MNYFKSRRGRWSLAAVLVTTTLFVRFPAIDIAVSRLFYDHGFLWQNAWPVRLLHSGLGDMLALTLIALILVLGFNKLRHRNLYGVDGPVIWHALIILALGAGLIVNVALKDHFGRARPRDIEEFGGHRHFTPAFVISDQCNRNCSFSSGEAAGAFFFLELARVLTRRRALLLAAAGFGCVISIARIASGAHFLSDVVTSFFVMWLVADASYFYLFRYRAQRFRVHRTRLVESA